MASKEEVRNCREGYGRMCGTRSVELSTWEITQGLWGAALRNAPEEAQLGLLSTWCPPQRSTPLPLTGESRDSAPAHHKHSAFHGDLGFLTSRQQPALQSTSQPAIAHREPQVPAHSLQPLSRYIRTI